jgi:hypothetical protein
MPVFLRVYNVGNIKEVSVRFAVMKLLIARIAVMRITQLSFIHHFQLGKLVLLAWSFITIEE